PVLNIDHHISNTGFGQVNWVDPKASCACELVWRLYKKMRLPISKEAAVCMYAGILTDTGSFRYSNTNSETHKITAELISKGINVPEVYRNIYGNVPYEDLKLLSRILPTMQRSADGSFVWFEIRKELLAGREKICFDLSENILNFARSLKGVQVVVLFKENFATPGEVRVNFRSQGAVDVNDVAQKFGGGGHKTASGATIAGRLPDIKRKVLSQVKRALNARNT
ncbi:MAG: bifunctional oligoribonuclease/PAP phosphatase NrnA, partial [Candidatus Omnitrophica bacterium]|nr:bifunctional oligoribonuclease/PAP phosphatase NrnA [Candidatus Omnitrophota bacterium]